MKRFIEFVNTEVGTTPQGITAYFNHEISQMSQACNIDWDKTKDKLKIGKNRSPIVSGLERKDRGRISVWLEVFQTNYIDGESFFYEKITFKNHRNSLGQPGMQFNCLTALFEQYEQYKNNLFSQRKPLPSIPRNVTSETEPTYHKEKEKKSFERMLDLKDNKVFSLYLSEKKVMNVAKNMQLNIKVGKKYNLYFTAFALYNINNIFGGLQRIYNTPINKEGDRKFTTKGFNPLGYFALFGTNDLSKEYILYVCEGLATGLSVLLATNRPVCICLFADNIPHVNKVISEKFPLLKRVIIADNDRCKPEYGNAGTYLASISVKNYGGWVFVPKISGKLTDANDIHVTQGIEELKKQISDKRNYLKISFCKNVEGIFNTI